jgi:two-component system, OmpR family, phosphate regulon sensor histidine kinase PhoR
MNKKPKTLILFYVLVAYIALQFVWWTYLLTNLTGEVYQLKKAGAEQQYGKGDLQIYAGNDVLKKKHHSRLAMIIGEGSVFLLLLGIGIYRVKKSFEKETQLASQQKNFMLSVTHELKTPLAAVKLNLQTMQKRELEKQQVQDLLANCLRETDRLNQLIENVLLAARMENAELKFFKEKINLSEFTEQHLSSAFNDPRITKQIEKNVFVNADRLALSSLLSNLVENALKYSEGTIAVKVFTANGLPVIEIADRGPGIPAGEKENVFRKFYRIGNEETRRTKGTGLGLFIVRYIADQNNISIQLKENHPKGSVFSLTFNGPASV